MKLAINLGMIASLALAVLQDVHPISKFPAYLVTGLQAVGVADNETRLVDKAVLVAPVILNSFFSESSKVNLVGMALCGARAVYINRDFFHKEFTRKRLLKIGAFVATSTAGVFAFDKGVKGFCTTYAGKAAAAADDARATVYDPVDLDFRPSLPSYSVIDSVIDGNLRANIAVAAARVAQACAAADACAAATNPYYAYCYACAAISAAAAARAAAFEPKCIITARARDIAAAAAAAARAAAARDIAAARAAAAAAAAAARAADPYYVPYYVRYSAALRATASAAADANPEAEISIAIQQALNYGIGRFTEDDL